MTGTLPGVEVRQMDRDERVRAFLEGSVRFHFTPDGHVRARTDRETGWPPLLFARRSAPDRADTVRALLDAGAATDRAWVAGKPPSRMVADVLTGYGIVGPADDS